jgi:hypothetical protein
LNAKLDKVDLFIKYLASYSGLEVEVFPMKKSAILGCLVLPWLTACASPQEGGMDGAGSIGLGLRWDQGLFTQAVWEEGALAYLVLNNRDEDVALTLSRASCSDTGPRAGCTYSETIATWRLPAHALRRFAGADVAGLSGAYQLIGVAANGTRLGLLLPEVAPFAASPAVISNAAINSTSGNGPSPGQIETDFLVAPAAAFTLGLSFSAGGELTLSSTTPSIDGLSFVDVVGARSEDASILPTEGGFSVVVPSTATNESPVRVDVDVRLPANFSGKFVGFDSFLCSTFESDGDCGTGRRFQRGLPVEPPLD